MALNFQFALGKNISWQWTPQDIAADGTHSNNAVGALNFIGRMEEFNGGTNQVHTTDLTPMDCYDDNIVDFGQITQYSFTEFQACTGHAGYSSLGQKGIRASRRWKGVGLFKDNAAVTQVTETVYVLWTTFDPNARRDGARCRLEGSTYALPTATPGTYTPNPGFS